jgi:hypothetical protein
MTEGEREHKYRIQNGETPGYKAFHEVFITKDLGSERNDEVVAFIDKHITEYKGHIEEKHGIPIMLFERKQDAQKFANILSEKLKIPGEHISIKAQKFTR